MNASVEQVAEEMGLKDDLEGIHAQHEGGMTYSIVSTRNGSTSYQFVELGIDPTCTCKDMEFNKSGGRECCDHITKAVMADRLSPEELAMQEMINRTGEFANAAVKAQNAADSLEDAVVTTRDAEAEATAEDGSGDRHTGYVPEEKNAEEAAEKLSDAFESSGVPDMEVQSDGGNVWFKTGYETPDNLDWRGNPDTWETLIKNPDMSEYDPDNGPGQYWKNYLTPAAVDEYISEVLGE